MTNFVGNSESIFEKEQIEKSGHNQTLREGLFPTPCASPKASLLANTLRRGKAVAIQSRPQNTIAKERKPVFYYKRLCRKLN